jgi:hypothetical protein
MHAIEKRSVGSYRISPRAAMPDQRWTDKVLVADDEYVGVRAVRESPARLA